MRNMDRIMKRSIAKIEGHMGKLAIAAFGGSVWNYAIGSFRASIAFSLATLYVLLVKRIAGMGRIKLIKGRK